MVWSLKPLSKALNPSPELVKWSWVTAAQRLNTCSPKSKINLSFSLPYALYQLPSPAVSLPPSLSSFHSIFHILSKSLRPSLRGESRQLGERGSVSTSSRLCWPEQLSLLHTPSFSSTTSPAAPFTSTTAMFFCFSLKTCEICISVDVWSAVLHLQISDPLWTAGVGSMFQWRNSIILRGCTHKIQTCILSLLFLDLFGRQTSGRLRY